MADNIYAILVS